MVTVLYVTLQDGKAEAGFLPRVYMARRAAETPPAQNYYDVAVYAVIDCGSPSRTASGGKRACRPDTDTPIYAPNK